MKILNLSLSSLALSLFAISCGSGNKDEAEKRVVEFSRYVDSVSVIKNEDLKENWESVEKAYTEKKLQAQSALETMSSNPDLRKNLDEANSRFKKFKNRFTIGAEKRALTERTMNFRKTFFDRDDISADLKFELAFKDNFVSVYENFINKVIVNQDTYSIDDWNEIKLIHDALTLRKKTIEEVEGFSTTENLKISKLKLKFVEVYDLKTTQ